MLKATQYQGHQGERTLASLQGIKHVLKENSDPKPEYAFSDNDLIKGTSMREDSNLARHKCITPQRLNMLQKMCGKGSWDTRCVHIQGAGRPVQSMRHSLSQ